MISGHNLEHLSATEHKLYLECVVAALQGMLAAQNGSQSSFSPSLYPETTAGLAFGIADAMIAEYRNRFELNER